MMLTIDKNDLDLRSQKAKYFSLKEAIKRQLAANTENDDKEIKLPSISALGKELELSSITIRRAFDDLTNEGLIYSIQGKGTYAWSKTYHRSNKEKSCNHIGLVYFLRNETIDLFNYIQDYTMKQNCLLTSYNVSEDNQDITRERMFLESLGKENFKGVIVLPSPNAPTNREVYQRMREDGIKVALVVPYAENMDSEVTFFEDYYHSGYMSVAKMGMAGFKKICVATTKVLPVAHQWFKNGVTQAIEDLNLELLEDLIPRINMNVKSLPEKTGIISTHTSYGYMIYELLVNAGIKLGEDIALCSKHDYTLSDHPEISCLLPPQKELLKAAVDYILDPKIEPTEIIHKTFKSKYKEHGTVSKDK